MKRLTLMVLGLTAMANAWTAPNITLQNDTATTMVSGVVVDQATGRPLDGAQLRACGHNRYTAMTDERGRFTIKLPVAATALYVHAPQYTPQQVGLGRRGSSVCIKMLPDKYRPMYGQGEDITAKNGFKARRTAATVDGEIGSTLGADMRVIMRSGAADGGANMFVRGFSSLNANAQPLIVVDGVELDMQFDRTSLHDGYFNNILANISPDDIERVEVLKNATALYGARGANGVIVITTKRSKSMATRIDANIAVGLTTIPQLPTMMNAAQYRSYATELLGTVDAVQQALKSGSALDFKFMDDNPSGYYYKTYHNDTQWKDYVFRQALTQNYSVNVQGGDDVGMYNLSVGYMDAQSTAKGDKFSRMNVRFNTDIEITRRLKTQFDISISRTNRDVFDDGIPSDLSSGVVTSPTFLALIKSPLVSPYEYNSILGDFSSLTSGYDELFSPLGKQYALANPVAILNNASGDNKNKAENTYFNVKVAPTWTLNKAWSVNALVSYGFSRNTQRYYRPYKGVPPFTVEGLGKVTSLTSSLFAKETNFVGDLRMQYERTLGSHSIAAYVGFRYNQWSYDDSHLSTEYTSETNDKNPSLSSSTGYHDVSGAGDTWKYVQWRANADYNYRQRYYLTLSLSAEANSRFGSKASSLRLGGVCWAVFPSIQAGWILTNESWFPSHIGIDYLQVHAGVDWSGNDGISNYAARTAHSTVDFMGQAKGLKITQIGNENIRWETVRKINAGVKAYMLDNRLTLAFDIYSHTTTDLLTVKNMESALTGLNHYWCNGGQMKNTGLEVSLSGKPIVAKDWQMEAGFSLGHYKNKVTQLPDGDYTTSLYGAGNLLTAVGQPVALFYGYQTAGILASDDEASHAGSRGYLYREDDTGNLTPFEAGDVRFIDRDNDGVISEADKTVIGDPNPDIYGNIFTTLSWKRFKLDASFNYSLAGDVYNYQRSVLNSGSTLYNQQVAVTSRWAYDGQTDALLPRAVYGDPMGNNRFSDRWIEDGSYLRMSSLALSYAVPIPTSWTWLQGLTVWAEARNLLTLTHYTGSDPEFSTSTSAVAQGIDCGNLPQSRTFMLGVKINL